MRRALQFVGFLALESSEGVRDIVRHEQLDTPGFIVPTKGNVEVAFAFSVFGDFVLFFYYVY